MTLGKDRKENAEQDGIGPLVIHAFELLNANDCCCTAALFVYFGIGIVREITKMLLSRIGGDLLSHVLRRSTIGAAALNGRVRDGIGCFARAMTTKPRQQHQTKS